MFKRGRLGPYQPEEGDEEQADRRGGVVLHCIHRLGRSRLPAWLLLIERVMSVECPASSGAFLLAWRITRD